MMAPSIRKGETMRKLAPIAIILAGALCVTGCSKKEEKGEESKAASAEKKTEAARPGEARPGEARPDPGKARPAPAVPQIKYQLYKSDLGRFSVEGPGQPKIQKTKVPTQAGVIDYHIFMFMDKSPACGGALRGCVMMASYADYPAAVIKKSDPEKILDGGRNGAVRKVKGKLVSEKKIKLAGFPGRDIRVEAPAPRIGGKMVIFARIFMVQNRMFMFQSLSMSQQATNPNMQKFLDSIKVWAKK